MRILHVVHDYLPDQVAGVEVYTNRVAEHLSADHTVAVLFATLDPSRPTGSVESNADGDVTLFSLAQNRDWKRFRQSWDDARVFQGVLDVLDAFEPDIVHIQHLMNLGLRCLDALELRRIPKVMSLHDQWWACAAGGQRFQANRERCDDLDANRCATCTATLVGPALFLRGRSQRRALAARDSMSGPVRSPHRNAPFSRVGFVRPIWSGLVGLTGASRIEERWAAMRQLGKRIEAFIAPSDEIRGAAIEFGFPPERVLRLSHGLPVSETEPSPLPEKLNRFGYVGSLVPHKGVHHLIQAFERMPTDASLDLYGALSDAPGYASELQSLIRHPGIRLHGERAPDEIPALLDSLHALVAPSIWRENAPLSVQEAFAAGRPVVASDLGGHPELLERGGGLLFEAGNVDSLAEVLLRLREEPGLGRHLASTIPAVRSIEDHVRDLGRLYAGVARESRDRADQPARGDRGVLFLDRDGVINHDSSDFIRSVRDWRPIAGSLEAIARFSRAGYRIIVVTNQSGIARSLLDEKDLAEIHARLESDVAACGGRIEAVLHCPHSGEDACVCRKPGIGLIDRAREEFAVDPAGAPFVGDRVTDLMAARAAGCRPVFVRSGVTDEEELGAEWHEIPRFDDLSAVAEALLGTSEADRPFPIPGDGQSNTQRIAP